MRKICVTSMGPTLDSPVDPRFGRCAYLLIIDVDSGQLLEAVSNPSVMAPSGAGIQTAETVASKGVEAVVTGNVGPNASQELSSAGIRVITGFQGTVREAVEAYRQGRLPSAGLPQLGFPGGRGLGRGMGMRGMGMMQPSAFTKEDEIAFLEAQMEALQKRLDEIKRRLRELQGD
ncbi:MAG: dinitrogenase iron-molybdenum cofactor biosynthesis protein [Candidatus Hecatellales archaeon]|nr:MAG: dinitrogenase iron-molybdenum cofactor biosynthesis protein [Candidatus Hecatellales archaeon]